MTSVRDMTRDGRLIEQLDTVGEYIYGKTDGDAAYATLLYVRSTLNLDMEEYRTSRPAPYGERWNIVTDPCMGSAHGALQDVLTKWKTWTEFTGATMGTRKSLDERDVRRREAESRLALAAGTLAWHLDRDPLLLTSRPAPSATGLDPQTVEACAKELDECAYPHAAAAIRALIPEATK